MLTTKKLSAKAARQYEVTWQSNQPAQTEVTHVTLTTPSRGSDMATYAINAATTATSPYITHNTTGGHQLAPPQQSSVSVNSPAGEEYARLGKWGISESVIRAMDLEKDVFKIPIDTLLNLWVTRFGNEWVDLEAVIDGDDFFTNAYKRLKQMGLLEQHYLTDRARYVCRKPE